MSDQPNFLIILTDQMRGDNMRCAWRDWRGNTPLQTPNLDRLAAGGALLTRAYVNNPLCMPSRSTLLTGLTPRGHNVRTNGIDLDPAFPTVTGTLADVGYRTHSIGKIHVRVAGEPIGVAPETLDPLDFPETRWMWRNRKVSALPTPYYGFASTELTIGHGPGNFDNHYLWLEREHPDVLPHWNRQASTPAASGAEQSYRINVPPEYHYNTWIADRSIAYLQDAAAREQPFMLWASFPDPHHPYAAPDPWFSMYDRDSIPAPTRRDNELDDLPPHMRLMYETDQWTSGRRFATKMPDEHMREITAITFGMMSFIDEQVGRMLDSLDELGLADNTIVVFTADHGDLLGDHWLLNKGPFHFDGMLNIPSIWRWPARFPAGQVSQSLVSHLNIPTTLLDLAEVPAPEYGPPFMKGVPQPEAERQMSPLPGKSLAPLLTGEAASVQDAIVIENDEDYIGLRLRTLVTDTHQLTVYVGDDGEQEYGELFDTHNDPGQLRNLWHEPSVESLKQELKARLMEELIRTDNRMPRRQSHA